MILYSSSEWNKSFIVNLWMTQSSIVSDFYYRLPLNMIVFIVAVSFNLSIWSANFGAHKHKYPLDKFIVLSNFHNLCEIVTFRDCFLFFNFVHIFSVTVWTSNCVCGDLWVVDAAVFFVLLLFASLNVCSSVEHTVNRSMQKCIEILNVLCMCRSVWVCLCLCVWIRDWISFTSLDAFNAVRFRSFGFCCLPGVLCFVYTSMRCFAAMLSLPIKL